MNEKQVINKLLTGLFHRPFATILSPARVQELADAYGINVEITAYKAEDSMIQCLFEVKP